VAIAGYPRTGRDLADGYMLAALVIRAMYDPHDPEIKRALRLYAGGRARLDALADALASVAHDVSIEIAYGVPPGQLPGEQTTRIPRHVHPE